jgi:hypothetical protein
MSESGLPEGSPLFETAKYESAPASDVCKLCQQPISGEYYRANAAMLCPGCADRVRSQLPQDSHAAFVRGILFGLGGFVVALIAYSLVGIVLRGWTIGYLALGVGWIIGKSMMIGSRGAGGRRYQLVAVLLTYAAVSMSAIPIGVSLVWDKIQNERSAKAVHSPEQNSQQPGATGQNPGDSSNPPKESEAGNTGPTSLGSFLGELALRGLASPFMELQSSYGGVIMLIILFVGMRFAWKITGASLVAVDGPYQTSSAAKA